MTMKRFLKYYILFPIPLFILIISLEMAIRHVPNPYKYKYEWMQKNAEDVEILVFGSSHSFHSMAYDLNFLRAKHLV